MLCYCMTDSSISGWRVLLPEMERKLLHGIEGRLDVNFIYLPSFLFFFSLFFCFFFVATAAGGGGVGGNNILGGWRTAAAFHPWVEWEGSLSFLVMESTGATERNEEPLLNPYLAPFVVVVAVLFFPPGETSHHHQTLGQMGRDI